MQLSHVQKQKIAHIGDDLKQELLRANDSDVIDLNGERNVSITFKVSDKEQLKSSLENAGIQYQDDQFTLLSGLGMAQYKPESLRADQLASLLEDSLVLSADKAQEMGVSH